MYKCEFIGEAMSVKRIFYLLILVPCVVFSQDFLNIQSLKKANDAELLELWNKASDNGYSLSQIKEIATVQGASNFDIAEFEERLNELLELESADLMVSSTDFVSSLVTQTDTELSEETGLTLFGKEFFLKSSLTTSPQLNIATPQLYQLGPRTNGRR